MPKICPLFSGSSGNCTVVQNKNSSILIDVGISAKRLTQELSEKGLCPTDIGGVFITHEHSDHIAGIRVFCGRNNIPVYMTPGTYNTLMERGLLSTTVDYRILEEQTDMGDINVSYFSTSHDAAESCGFLLETGGRKIAICTDLGTVTDEVRCALLGADLVMLESNHDADMLKANFAYPLHLKRRIMSESGHLSNNACAGEIVSLAKSGSTRFVLAHLSRENNNPALAKETTRSLLRISGLKENSDYTLTVAKPFDNKMVIV